ncbi:MAG: heme-binding domain-containing protein [Bacteroidota bacterium]
MKKVLFVSSVVITALLFMNFSMSDGLNSENVESPNQIDIPEDVQAIIDNSCYGCHNTESKNTKGKKKLEFDALNSLKKYKVIGKLTEITEVVSENEMPPEKFLNKYPEKALTEEQKSILINWSDDTAKKLAGE